MNTTISRVSADILMVEQHNAEDRLTHTVILTTDDIVDICLIVWPESTQSWIDVAAELALEKNPQGAP